MSKTLFVIFAALLVVSIASPVDQLKELIRNDQCATSSMGLIEPQIKEQVEKLKQNSQDLVAKAELLKLVQKAKNIFDACNLNQKAEPVLGDAVKAAGIAFLLASNCFKDVGAVLLIGDTIIQDPSDWQNDIIVLIFVALLGRQAYADCEQFIGFIW